MKKLVSRAALAAGIISISATVAVAADLEHSAQYRPRFELQRGTVSTPNTVFAASHRARLTLGYGSESWKISVAPQHVLVWGSSGSTLSGLSGDLDFHTAFAQYAFTDTTSIRIGRQEIAIADQRLIGSVNWTQQGRSFDAVSVNHASVDKTYQSTSFAAIVHEGGSIDELLAGVHFTERLDSLSISGMAILEQSRRRVNGDEDFVRVTPGLLLDYSGDALQAGVSAYGQFGTVAPGGTTSQSIAAALVAANVLVKSESAGHFGWGLDFLTGSKASGSGPDAFDTLYATNHKFYGSMDYFLNLPVHTGGLGLIDSHMTWSSNVLDNLDLGVKVHQFLAANETAAGNRNFATEFDHFAKWKFKPATLVGGYSFAFHGDALKDIGRVAANDDIGHWLWLMLDVQL